ncbi:hypothetical protein B0T25DRAFT_330808 [Lasiosphaeria hispida]|uniref:SUZ domain-containing protein n=1 Tax=Lasiosphaeria hispida TaxID=260671 RepID=A0AAJ0M7V9_9PEZI|nr:hypothetical protein B0T25DRAFT_330808 [Lasiosphaeria hispida]
MPKNNQVPDAWDDDWEAQADGPAKEPAAQQPAPQDVPMTRAERLAKHAEEQRKLWESAEAPPEFNFIAATSTVPLATPFKPAVKVLSRKPAPKLVTRKDPITGLEQLTFQDDDDDEDESKKHQPTPEEIRMRQQRELEEKQRRYDEARAKIFGDSNPSSGHSTPGNVTPPQSGEGRQSYKGRGGRGRSSGGHRNNNRQEEQSRRPPSSQQPGTRELFDPSYAPKPGFNLQRRAGDASPQQGSRSHTPREEDQSVIRAPRGPDGSGRGGFGFARRGGSQED